MQSLPGPDHPADHFRCDADCPCSCATPDWYEANAGTMCWNCSGLVRRKRAHRFELIAQAGGISVLTSVFEELPRQC